MSFRVAALLLAGALTGCVGARPVVVAPATAPIATLPRGVADSVSSMRLQEGLVLHHLVRNAGPLRIDVLDVDLTGCVTLQALKGGSTAIGRRTTSAMLESALMHDRSVAAAVNADFFLFAPPGVPVGALVEDWRIITGPIERPVLAFDARNLPFIGPMAVATTVRSTRDSVVATTWNRPRAQAVGIVDAAWAQALDSVIRPTARVLVPLGTGRGTNARYLVWPLPAAHPGIALGDTLMLTGRGTTGLADGDTVTLQTTWSPVRPWQAVGGFPLLLRDSLWSPTLDTDGAEGFRGRNPRTAAGYTRDKGRLFLVVIDGRQPGYSIGTTTRETADVLRSLGAVDAINLDGGGSSVLVVRDDPASPRARVVSRPSDAAGERPVGDALSVRASCGHGVPPRRAPAGTVVP
ncbi:MAG: phosphodiester glycosidase family protein [Gemmatimonadaceae bacterium]|nr:phosphodiester glycosidase family protein [Gemmatimonadaceae bacterium]